MTDALHSEKNKYIYHPQKTIGILNCYYNSRGGGLATKIYACLATIVIAALDRLVTYKLNDFESWEIWDTLIQKEPIDTPVILSPTLQNDTNGALIDGI